MLSYLWWIPRFKMKAEQQLICLYSPIAAPSQIASFTMNGDWRWRNNFMLWFKHAQNWLNREWKQSKAKWWISVWLGWNEPACPRSLSRAPRATAARPSVSRARNALTPSSSSSWALLWWPVGMVGLVEDWWWHGEVDREERRAPVKMGERRWSSFPCWDPRLDSSFCWTGDFLGFSAFSMFWQFQKSDF